MSSYLSRLAQTFAREVGSELPQYTFVFPNHRAGLFFRKYLSQALDKPVFSPEVLTINECFAQLTDLRLADQLTLLVRLYDLYRRQRPDAEPIEQFLYWGKMMLSDFSEIDNHLIPNVEALFYAVRDLHDIDDRFRYLTDNQRDAIRRFWGEFLSSEAHHPDSTMHPHFLRTWQLLYPLYTALRQNLLSDGLAYDGLLHREVIEHFDSIDPQRLKPHYVFVGFNALTESERQLMLHLQALGQADFYFDYENSRLRDPDNRASLFMADNQRLFQSRYTLPASGNTQDPECRLISVPSTIAEAHEVHHILKALYTDARNIDFTRTAVVLPDEQLLIPLLGCFPPDVEKINVTMGYPLRATALYMPVAYPEQFLSPMPDTATDYIAQMRALLTSMRTDENAEGVYQLLKVLDKITAVLTRYPDVPFSVEAAQQVLRMLTMEASIPYVGEPLNGLQVMGVLETRALDFDNLIITGFNDDLYPGRTRGNSFVPYVLRKGFGLPTPERQDAIFAYNFYRMLSYAKRVWFITNSTADEQHSGEVSRYFYQLQWQYHVPIEHETVISPLNTPARNSRAEAPKTDEVLQALRDYARKGISPSALNQYLRCPKQFYYRHVLGIHEPEQDEDVSVADTTLGSVLHDTIQHLYQPYEGKQLTASAIETLRADFAANAANDGLLDALKGDILAEQVVRNYVRNILDFDLTQVPLLYVATEQSRTRSLQVPEVGDVLFYGKIDRIDERQGSTRIIDYKTGHADLEFTDMAQVFDRKRNKSQVLQTLLYCWLTGNGDTSPHIYPVRRMADTENTETAIHRKGEVSLTFSDVESDFLEALRDLIAEIFDTSLPFSPTADIRSCDTCPFAALCR